MKSLFKPAICLESNVTKYYCKFKFNFKIYCSLKYWQYLEIM